MHLGHFPEEDTEAQPEVEQEVATPGLEPIPASSQRSLSLHPGILMLCLSQYRVRWPNPNPVVSA